LQNIESRALRLCKLNCCQHKFTSAITAVQLVVVDYSLPSSNDLPLNYIGLKRGEGAVN